MQYKYKGMDRRGRSVKGTISANSEDEAKRKLRAQGIFYKSVSPANEIAFKSMMTRQMPGTVLSSFSKEMASYFGSGMTILTALKLMENQHKDEKKYHAF